MDEVEAAAEAEGAGFGSAFRAQLSSAFSCRPPVAGGWVVANAILPAYREAGTPPLHPTTHHERSNMDTTRIKTRIFTAPAGWGKTRHARSLANFLNCASVVDEWCPGQATPHGALLLTNIEPDDLLTWACSQTDAPVVIDVGWRFDSAEQYLGKPLTATTERTTP